MRGNEGIAREWKEKGQAQKNGMSEKRGLRGIKGRREEKSESGM